MRNKPSPNSNVHTSVHLKTPRSTMHRDGVASLAYNNSNNCSSLLRPCTKTGTHRDHLESQFGKFTQEYNTFSF